MTFHLQPFDDARVLDRFIADLQADDLFQRQHMRAAQVKVRVRRRKSVKVRAPDRGEQQRIRLRREVKGKPILVRYADGFVILSKPGQGQDDAVKAWVNGPCCGTQGSRLASRLNMT